jgi:hypothetical protein
MDWIYLAQDSFSGDLVITVMNRRVPLYAVKFSSGCTVGAFSKRAQLCKVRWLIN